MCFDAVLFDLDGTLLDTSEGVIKAIDYIAEQYQLPKLPMREKKTFIGPPIQSSLMRHYGLSKERAWDIASAWRDAYKDLFLLEARPYDGIYDVLQSCHKSGIKTGVATNKREDYTVKLLDYFGFTAHFDCITGTDFAGKLDKADLICVCMKKLGVAEPDRCLMVGDTVNDLEAAEKAGVHFLGVAYGFGFKCSDMKPLVPLASSCKDISKFIFVSPGESNAERDSI